MVSQLVRRGLGIALATLLGVSGCATPHPPAPAATVTDRPPPIVGTGTPRTATPPAATPEATPEPTPEIPAAESLQLAANEAQNGRYEVAAPILRTLVAPDVAAEVRREALLRLGYCDLQLGLFEEAAATVRSFLAGYPQDAEAPAAWYWLGEALAGLGDGPGAASAYRSYLERNPLLESQVQARIGDALAGAGDHAGAIAAYRPAADSAPDANRRVTILESLAASQRALQQYPDAAGTYEEILGIATIAAYRAEIVYAAGDALREGGDTAGAAAHWNDLVATYPESTQAAQALPILDGWGLAQVDPVTRARVDYAAGRYEDALAALGPYVRGDPAHSGDAHYYAGLSYRGLGRHQESIREFDLLIQTHPQNSLVPEAWFQKAESLALLGSVDAAAAAFQQMAAGYPQHARAAQALWRAAQVYEQSGRSWDASAAYMRAANAYPAAPNAADARFRAGLAHYLNKAVQTAASTWVGVLAQEKDPAMRARLLLWLGKAKERLGEGAAASERWAEAVSASPASYWGLRARDLLAGRLFDGQAPAGAFDPALYAPRGTQAEAEAWLSAWAGRPPEGRAATDLPAPLTGLDAFQRALELQHLGEAGTAGVEFRQVLATEQKDPWALYALSLYCRDRRFYQPSITCAERVLAMAPDAARASPPRLLVELAYPTYYADLVLAEGRPSNTDPLLFFALMRQESLFDHAATSRADARGLTQVIPSTGSYIAGKLADAAYTPERLWWPAVSVHYGMWYFSSALGMFQDDALAALVGYNAGPGNASKWVKLADGDQDLFFESVTLAEPRAYMRRIYEHRAHYEELYR